MSKIELRDAMNESPHTETHTFPIPETESRRLDEIQGKLQQQKLQLKARDFVTANCWSVLAASFVTGFLLGVCVCRTIAGSSPE